jgi:hypothetical protein
MSLPGAVAVDTTEKRKKEKKLTRKEMCHGTLEAKKSNESSVSGEPITANWARTLECAEHPKVCYRRRQNHCFITIHSVTEVDRGPRAMSGG